jgi:hypothetical protein
VTRGNVVLAWPLPKTPCELEGGAAPESCAEYYANGGERPIVYVTRSSKDGALLMTSAGGASSGGVVTVTRCDANGGTFRELGAASLPGAPAVTAVASIPSPTGGVVAAVGCADGELYLLECPPNGGELIVKRADRDAETGGGGGGGATTPPLRGRRRVSLREELENELSLELSRDEGEVVIRLDERENTPNRPTPSKSSGLEAIRALLVEELGAGAPGSPGSPGSRRRSMDARRRSVDLAPSATPPPPSPKRP